MFRKSFVSLSAIMLVIICGSLGLNTAQASYPLLKLDWGADHVASKVEPGFIAFTTEDSGNTFKGITVTLALIDPDPSLGVTTAPAWNLRDRGGWSPTGIPYELLYRDHIFARPGGIRITLEGLKANESYEITIWAWDIGSAGDRIADWYANGVFCLTTYTNNGTPPVDETSNRYIGTAQADDTGTIILESYPNENSVEQSGANNPYAIVAGFMISAINPITEATEPVPDDGETVPSAQVRLEWVPGMMSSSSNVYFGETFEDVNNATANEQTYLGSTTEGFFLVGSEEPYPTGLMVDKTYYWRVDEVNELNPEKLWKGPVWSFYVPPRTASNPMPVNGALFADANYLDPDVILSWYPATDATSYHVYFGDNLESVQAGIGGTDKGAITDPNYDPASMLELNKTYYWRIDTSEGTATHTGDVWSFNTSPADLGAIDKDIWEDVTSNNDLDVLKNDTRYPNNPTVTETLTSFDTGSDAYALANYGGQLSGWLYVPLTGEYTFWLCSAGQGELWLSTDEDPDNVEILAFEPVWGNLGGYAFSQRSNPVSLVGGNKYYIMGIWVSVDWDFCQVAWQGAGIRDQQIIRGCYLSPYLPVNAYGASPANDATDIDLTKTLSWNSGIYASQHLVFFGTDPNAVRDADTSSPEYKVTQPLGTESFNPGIFELNTTYYWRVDEVNNADPNSPWIGKVWSFTSGDYVVIDDFEAYNDINEDDDGSNRIYLTWSDGYANPNVNGSTIGYPAPDFANGEHFVETDIVHNGNQSGPLVYNTTTASYAEVELSSSATSLGSNWTQRGLNTLSIWFYGDPNNAGTEQLYVKLNDSKLAISNVDLTLAEWQNVEISLADFNINPANVTQLVIGLDKNGAGSEGVLLMDDIRVLYIAQ
ncbi:MAG: hypothetical protein JW715_05680 [Sedimentisphaerales bacterium]|nr:hypothetical protein [Sedimentisphaerales bacterium]